MIRERVKVNSEKGFSINCAADFALEMAGSHSTIKVIGEGKIADGKSLIDLLQASFHKGSELEIVCDGSDEKETAEKAVKIFKCADNYARR